MSDERRQILDMLAAGKISVEDAERLLEKLAASGEAEPESGPSVTTAPGFRPKFLRVHMGGSDGEKINVRVPLALIKTGIKLTALLPTEANEKLRDRGVDLSNLAQLETEELMEAIRDLKVDVEGDEGEAIRVFCE